MFDTSRICSVDPFTPLIDVKHLGDSLVHTSTGSCIPVFNRSVNVKHPFHKIIQILSFNKSRAKEVIVTGTKNVTHLIRSSDAEELDFIHHITSELDTTSQLMCYM